MIHVDKLSKIYGAVQAISGVSFQSRPAQWSDCWDRMAPERRRPCAFSSCGCIGATEGSATIDGKDVAAAPAAVKASIGYLPETLPLYGHMVVRDFIRFAATIKGVTDPDAATDAVIETVGLDQDVGGMPAADRIIATCRRGTSSGSAWPKRWSTPPSVLVLDEPTSGLDPAQRRDLRDLLQRLARAQNRTVILSTHVLAEVEAICDEVVIISGGRVVAQDRIDALRGTGSPIRLRVGRPCEELVAALANIEHVSAVTEQGEGQLQLTVTADVRAAVARASADFDS